MVIHDEAVYEVSYEEADIIPDLKRIMEEAYPHKILPLACSVAKSEKSWQDLE